MFAKPYRAGVIPGLPWCAGFGDVSARAPKLGADTGAVRRDMLGCSAVNIVTLCQAGTLG